jgi:hypothetical protein
MINVTWTFHDTIALIWYQAPEKIQVKKSEKVRKRDFQSTVQTKTTNYRCYDHLIFELSGNPNPISIETGVRKTNKHPPHELCYDHLIMGRVRNSAAENWPLISTSTSKYRNHEQGLGILRTQTDDG